MRKSKKIYPKEIEHYGKTYESRLEADNEPATEDSADERRGPIKKYLYIYSCLGLQR
jgi:hypothetical protein